MGQPNKPSVGISDDYAVLKAKNATFYYGYEQSVCGECGHRNINEYCDIHPDAESVWCFVATIDGMDIVIPNPKLGTSDKFSMEENLLMGIGWILAKYKLTIEE